MNVVNRDDKDGMFSIGQSLRIRVGPLKGYLCRVLAVRRSDITVKLDSQQKILTGLVMVANAWWLSFDRRLSIYCNFFCVDSIVKSEHLAEVRGKSSAISMGYHFI